MKSLIKSLGILTFLFAVAPIDPAHAGIVISDGELKSWTLDDEIPSTTARAIYFYKGSAEDVDSDVNLEDEPWWKDGLQAGALAEHLIDHLSREQSYIETLTGQTQVEYKFAFDYSSADTITSHAVFSNFGEWSSTYDLGRTFNDRITHTGDSPWTFYWASTTPLNSSQVPEPSTAIAMGLLGMAGFAGNRRRRCQR